MKTATMVHNPAVLQKRIKLLVRHIRRLRALCAARGERIAELEQRNAELENEIDNLMIPEDKNEIAKLQTELVLTKEVNAALRNLFAQRLERVPDGKIPDTPRHVPMKEGHAWVHDNGREIKYQYADGTVYLSLPSGYALYRTQEGEENG